MKTLVVGGTGMLSGVVRSLVDAGDQVYVLARTPDDSLDGATHLAADYRDPESLRAALGQHAPFERVIAWIHSDAPAALVEVARHLTGPFFWVRSSAAADPARAAEQPLRDELASRFNLQGLHEIVLGFVKEGAIARWLTHAEICDGVLAAMAVPTPRSIVGVIEPWSARPAT